MVGPRTSLLKLLSQVAHGNLFTHTRAFASTHAKAAAAALVELGCFRSDHCSYAKRDRLVRGHCRGGALTGHWQAGIGVSDHERLWYHSMSHACVGQVLLLICLEHRCGLERGCLASWRAGKGTWRVLCLGARELPTPPPLTHTTPNTHTSLHLSLVQVLAVTNEMQGGLGKHPSF